MNQYIPIFLFIFFLTSCDIDSKKDGSQFSQSIKDSKANGVFIRQINLNKNKIRTGQFSFDSIKEIWIENSWHYERKPVTAKIKADTTIQILILFDSSSTGYDDETYFKNGEEYFGKKGVLFGPYFADKDTIFVVKKEQQKNNIIDTLIIRH